MITDIRKVCTLALIISVCFIWIPDSFSQVWETSKSSKYLGWDYLVQKLQRDRVDQQLINSVYQNPKMPLFERITFSLDPSEKPRIYRGFTDKTKIKSALEYLHLHQSSFKQTEMLFGVSKYVIAAILLVETNLGKTTGKHLVINRLSRLGSIAEPRNLQFNYERHKKKDSKVTFEEVRDRALYLEERFYPEIKALFIIAKLENISVLDITGSYAGAFGISQFLPTSYLNFAVDGNRDGSISLFQHSDAIASTANFLASFGWQKDATFIDKKKVLWRYNHSQPYIDIVMKIALILEERDSTNR